MNSPDIGLAWLSGQTQAQAELLAGLDDPAWLVDGGTLCVRCANDAAEHWLGAPAGTLAGRAAEVLLPSLEDAAFWAGVEAGEPHPLRSEVELPRADGGVATVLRHIAPLAAGPGGAADWLVTLRDLSRERAAEREREVALAELRATLEATADGILVTDLAGGIRAFNRRFARLWSLPEQALAERDDARIHAWMKLNVTRPEAYQRRLDEIGRQLLISATDTLRLVDGTLLECHTQPQWSQGRPIGRVHSFRELNRQRAGAPRRDAGTGLDDWTRLPHRDAFVERLAGAVAGARAGGPGLAVLCIDFDRAALYGLAAPAEPCQGGLAELAAGLQAGLRGPAVLARLGSARFGVLLEHAGDAMAEGVARRWQDLAGATPGGGATVFLGLRPVVGIASYPQAGVSADDLLAHAELAVAQARHEGRPCRVHRLAAPEDSQRQRRLESALREGLAEPQFRLQYQPRIATASGQVQAVEALVRWRDPAHGELLPAQFLPLADKAGLMAVLDDWVLEHALQQAAQWREHGLSLGLGVNVGGAQLSRPGFARRVQLLLEHAAWPAAQLEIDVTESALALDPEASLATLRALRSLGVRLVLDAFGAGQTPLALLRRFPLDAVRIDRSVLRDAQRQGDGGGWLQGLAALATALRLELQVEGVETEAQRARIAALGCSAWQGFLHAPAMDPQRLPAWCRSRPGAAA